MQFVDADRAVRDFGVASVAIRERVDLDIQIPRDRFLDDRVLMRDPG